MVLLNRIGNVLGLSSSSKRAPWWPIALLALAVPLAIWLASTNVHSSTENQTAAAELNKAPLDKAQLDRAELDRWVEKATSPAQSEFDAAVDALVAMGPEVAQEMIPLLKSGRTDQLGLKVLKRLAPEPSVQRILINAIEEARPNRHPNVIHCGLLALGKSGNLAHAGFIAGFLETHDLAAMSALETLGGERARDHLIGAFDLVPTERWFVLAGKLERLGDPAAVPELKKRLTQVELPPNDRFPPATVGAMTGAISALSDEQETFTTREYCQGQHFQYPFDGPGSPKTFSVNPLKDHYVRLPKVDPQTEAGREAIWKVLAEATEGPGFTIDGNEMVTFHGLKTAPLWPDGRPYPITLYDWLRRTSHQVLLDLIEQEKQTGRTAIPRGGLLVALDPAGRLYVLSLKKTSEQFTYDVTVMPQDPNMQLIPVRADAEAMQLTDTASCTLHDLESETKDGSLNLSRGHYVTMTQEKWQAESTDAVLVAEFAGNHTALGIPGAEQFVLAEAADAWEQPEKVLSLLKAAAKQEPTIAGHESLEQDGAIFHTFSQLSEGQKFAFAVEMPDGPPVAGILEVRKVDRKNETIRLHRRSLFTVAAREVFSREGRARAEEVSDETVSDVMRDSEAASDPLLRNEILPILQSLKQDVAALSQDYPQLAKSEAIEATADRWLFEHDCRDLGKRGYEDTGPFPLAIGLRFMTVAQFGAQIDTVEMRHPSRQWEYLGLVGWVTLHTGPETPGGLVSKLQEALEKAQAQIGTLNRQALAAQLPQAIQEERDRLLVEADTAIRQGILDLAQRYPLLKKGQPWDRLKLPSESGRIGIYLRRQEGGKGSTDTVPFPPSEAFGILVAVKQPPDQIEQLSLTSLYPSLGLVGQVNTQAADSGLDAALKRLVTEALAPFSELDNLARRVAADKSRSDVSITGQLLGIDGKPAAPGYRVTALPRAWSTQSGMMPTTLTDEQGVFVFHNLPDGPCDVAATPNALTNQPNMRIKGVVLKKGEPVYVKLSLEQEYHFAGQVTDAKGRPQPERNVQAIWKDPSSGKHTYSSNTKTNAFGRYRFSSPFEVAARILVNDGGTTDSPEQQEVKHGQDDVDLQLPADGDLRIRARPATITTQPEKMPPILIDVWNGSEDFELSLQPIAVEIDGEWFQSEGAMIIDRLPPRIMPGKSSFGNKYPAQHLGQYWLNDDDLKRVEFPAEGEYTLRIKFHAMRGAEKRDVITSAVKVGVEKPKDDVTQVNLLGLDDDTLITFFSTGEFLRRVAFDCEAFYDDRDHLPKDVPELASRYQEQSRDSIGIDPFAPDKKLRLILDKDDPRRVQVWSVGPDGDWDGGHQIDSTKQPLDGDLGVEIRVGNTDWHWLADETMQRYLKGQRLAHYLAAKGPKLPKPDLKDNGLNWGPVVDGLQLAVVVSPEKDAYQLGETIDVKFHVRNAADYAIQVGVAMPWRQDLNERTVSIQDENGKSLKGKGVWFSGIVGTKQYTLKPGEKASYESCDLAFVAPDERPGGATVGYWIESGPGVYTVRFKQNFPIGMFSEPRQWRGILETGAVTIRIAEHPEFAIHRVTGYRKPGDRPGMTRTVAFRESGNPERFDSMQPDRYPLEDLVINDTPLISGSDVIAYDWSRHVIRLTPEAFARFTKTVKPSVWGVPFVVHVEGTPVYLGAFWTGASSYSADMPTISLDRWDESLPQSDPHHLPPHALRIENSRVLTEAELPDDPRRNERLYRALQAAGKLLDPRSHEPPWGETVEGIQSRLRPGLFRNGEQWLNFDLRNDSGDLAVQLSPGGVPPEILVDDVAYRWSGRIAGAMPVCKPRQRVSGATFKLGDNWVPIKTVSGPETLELKPGKHTIQAVVYAAEQTEDGGSKARILSNPIEIEIPPVEDSSADEAARREVESAAAEKNERRWSIESHPNARLAHGWVSFDKEDGVPVIREHGGAGASQYAMDEPVELIVRWEVVEDVLNLAMTTRWKDKTLAITARTSCPEGSALRVREPAALSKPTKEHQVFWRGDFVKAGQVVKSVAHLVRLSPLEEEYDGFGKREIPKVLAAIQNEPEEPSEVDTVPSASTSEVKASLAVSPGPDHDGVIRGKVIAGEGEPESAQYCVMLDHELWTNNLGELPNLAVSPDETFEFRNVPAGKCTVRAQRIVADEGSMKPKKPIEVEVLVKNGQTVEVELRFDAPQASSVWGPAVEGIQFTDVQEIVGQWIGLVEKGDRDAAAKLMLRGKNENADDALSMTVALEAAARGNISLMESHSQPKAALVVSKPIAEGKYAGRSFVFHMARAVRTGDAWRIHEVSLVRPADLKAQLEAFRAKPVDRPIGPRGFGPTFERVLSRDDTHTESLDLDTNRVIRMPNDLGMNRDITQDPLKWMAVRGIDISLHHNPNRESELTGLSGIFAGTRRVENSVWDESDADEVRKLLGTDRKFGSWQTPAGEYPMTYLFETMGHPTRTPRQGVLQLLAVDREKQRVTVRYKLVGDPAGDKEADELKTPVPVTQSTGETVSKSGDRVALQVLYVPGQVGQLPHNRASNERVRALSAARESAGTPLLSNRLEIEI